MNEIVFVDPYGSEEMLEVFKTILPEDFDDNNKNFSLIGACDEEGVMLGVLGFDDLGEQCNILWLYVEPFARRMGVASALIEEMIEFYCNRNDVKPIAIRFEEQAGGDSLHSFFEANKYFDIREEFHTYSAYVRDIIDVEKLGEKAENAVDVKRFFDMSPARQQVFLQEMREEGYFDVRDFDEWSKNCVTELCLCTVEDYTVKSAIFMSSARENEYEIAFVYSSNPIHMFSIIKIGIMATSHLNSDAIISASIMSEISGQIFCKIFRNIAKSQPILTAEWNYEIPPIDTLLELQGEDYDYEVVELW